MNKVKILIVEDEILIADNICDALNALGYDALEPVINYTEAIETIDREHPDIAILDIQLSGKKTGIDLAKKIKESYNFPFIFLTSNTDTFTVNEAKKVMPPAYLVKPFTKEELYTAIEIALYNFSKRITDEGSENLIIKEALFIKEKNSFIKIPFHNIEYIKSAHVYLEICLNNGKSQLIRGSLNDIITKLNTNFIQVHRSFIVNSDHLEEIHKDVIKLKSTKIPIGKKYREDLINKINVM